MVDTFEGKTEKEAIAKGIVSGVDEFVGNEFCADDCLGWDGEDRRCNCGNRRLIWQTENMMTEFGTHGLKRGNY